MLKHIPIHTFGQPLLDIVQFVGVSDHTLILKFCLSGSL